MPSGIVCNHCNKPVRSRSDLYVTFKTDRPFVYTTLKLRSFHRDCFIQLSKLQQVGRIYLNGAVGTVFVSVYSLVALLVTLFTLNLSRTPLIWVVTGLLIFSVILAITLRWVVYQRYEKNFVE